MSHSNRNANTARSNPRVVLDSIANMCLLLLRAALMISIYICAFAPEMRGGSISYGELTSLITVNKSTQQEYSGLSGIVYDEENTPLPGVQIEAIQFVSGLGGGTTITDYSGRFNLRLPLGRYKITASLQGFSTKTYDITLQFDAAMTLNVTLARGDIVPEGEPNISKIKPIIPEYVPKGKTQPCTICVIENTFSDDTNLHSWLNEQAAKGKIVFAIIPLKDRTSLFCVKPGSGAAYSVITEDGVLDRKKIQARVDLNISMVLIGVHRLTNKFVMVFINGK